MIRQIRAGIVKLDTDSRGLLAAMLLKPQPEGLSPVPKLSLSRRVLFAGAGALLVAACARLMTNSKPAFTQSDHFDGRRFFNPHMPETDKRSFADLLRWQRNRPANSWPIWIDDSRHPPPQAQPPELISVTFLGHASFYLRIGGKGVLIDPVYSPRASPVSFAGPRRIRAPGQPLGALPGVDVLLVSHNHYDHLDLDTLAEVNQIWAPPTVTGLGVDPLLRQAELKTITPLDWWQSVEIAGLRITYVPAQHFSARGLFDRDATLWGGFVIQAGQRSVYFCGDSGYCPHFREIGERFPGLDIALLPIGAYEPRWFMRPMHMNPAEAVQAFTDLGAKRAIGMHFGTYSGLTDEAVDAPLQALADARQAHNIDETLFGTLAFGQTLLLDPMV